MDKDEKTPKLVDVKKDTEELLKKTEEVQAQVDPHLSEIKGDTEKLIKKAEQTQRVLVGTAEILDATAAQTNPQISSIKEDTEAIIQTAKDVKDTLEAHNAPMQTPVRRGIAFLLYGVAFGLIILASIASRKATRQEKIVKGFFHSAEQAICIVDTNRRILLWSRGAEIMFGYNDSEVVGEKIDFLIPSDMLPVHNRDFDKAFAKSDKTSNTPTSIIRCDAKHKTGTLIPVRIGVRFFTVEDETFVTANFDDNDNIEFFNVNTGKHSLPKNGHDSIIPKANEAREAEAIVESSTSRIGE